MTAEHDDNEPLAETSGNDDASTEAPNAVSRARIPGVAMAGLFWVVAIVFWGQHFMGQPEPPARERTRFGNVSTQLQLMVQGKVLIGQSMAVQQGGTLAGAQTPFEELELEARDGAAARALAALHLFLYPDDVDGALEQLESADNLEPGEPELNALVRQEIVDPGTLSQPQLDELQYQMHWFAHPLFLAREAPSHADRLKLSVQVMMLMLFGGGAMMFVLGGFLLGLVLLTVAAGRQLSGRSLLRFDASRGGSRLQIWAFIAYLGVMGVPIALYSMGIVSPFASPLARVAAFCVSIILGLSIAVFLPRGTFRERTRALGLHTGRGLFREVGSGIVGYCCVLPIAALGGLVSLALWWVTSQFPSNEAAGSTTGHPIGDMFFDAPAIARLGLLLLAAVGAPLIEETMFRGALHRGLRRSFSLPVAGLIGAVCFAAVHPQHIVALPTLAALAIGFTLIREWRDSLIAPMVAHGLHNGMLITGLWLATM